MISKNCPFDHYLNQRILPRQIFTSHYDFSAAEYQVFPGMKRRNSVMDAFFFFKGQILSLFPSHGPFE